jgi:hypothetical protein
LSGCRKIEVVPFNRKTIREGYASARWMSGVAPNAGLQQHGMKHAEFRNFATDAVDFHPVAEADAIAAH